MKTNIDYLVRGHLATLESRRKRLLKMRNSWDFTKNADARWIDTELQMLDFFEYLIRDLFNDEGTIDEYGYEFFRIEDREGDSEAV